MGRWVLMTVCYNFPVCQSNVMCSCHESVPEDGTSQAVANSACWAATYSPASRPSSKRSSSNPGKSRLRRQKWLCPAHKHCPCALVKPWDRARCTPRLLGRLLGQARNWGGFVRVGGGGEGSWRTLGSPPIFSPVVSVKTWKDFKCKAETWNDGISVQAEQIQYR